MKIDKDNWVLITLGVSIVFLILIGFFFRLKSGILFSLLLWGVLIWIGEIFFGFKYPKPQKRPVVYLHNTVKTTPSHSRYTSPGRTKTLLNGLCQCDRCSNDLKKGQGALNNRDSRLYCNDCWNHMKKLDPNGEELILNETWEEGVKRTNSVWS